MIAHQWRQPLTTISMGANNVLADVALNSVDNQELEKRANEILEQTQYLSNTIDDFKNFFKPDRVLDEVNVNEVIHDVIRMMGKSFEDNHIVILTDLENSYSLKLYSKELMQVLINLFNNAKDALLKENPKVRQVLIRTYEDKQNVIIEIEDNGGGIESGNMDKIFEPYFTTKEEYNGTGLGLYMSKTIVQKHLSGEISVSNREHGACFTITLSKSQTLF
jgi:signal transduction histidine kinase